MGIEVNGREINFKYSVGACVELDRLCAEEGVETLDAYLDIPDNGRRIRNRIRFICVLSLMGEKAAAFEAPGYRPKPLTYDEVATMTPREFADVFSEAVKACANDKKRTIEAVITKKTEAGA